ncbi:MAG: hypothetical protein K6T85_12370 [Gorillibacterium sp.]|nr:hypothetical protein [Gorillibacterium sp.]
MSKKSVKIFVDPNISGLENSINQWLHQNHSKEIIAIEYSASDTKQSALILYKEVDHV